MKPIAVLLMAAISSATAAPLICAEDAVTNAYFCFSDKELREEAGIRTAPLYTGGPNGVERTSFQIAANCATRIMHLKDRLGVSFAGAGPGEGTTQSRELVRNICATNLPTSHKKK
jgi:hypothetical protein